MVAQVLAERAAYARYKQQLVASTAALGAALTTLTFGLYSRVGPPRAIAGLAHKHSPLVLRLTFQLVPIVFKQDPHSSGRPRSFADVRL